MRHQSVERIKPSLIISSVLIHVVAVTILISVWFFVIPELFKSFEEFEFALSNFSQILIRWNKNSLLFWWLVVPILIVLDACLLVSLWCGKKPGWLIFSNLLVAIPATALICYVIYSFIYIQQAAIA